MKHQPVTTSIEEPPRTFHYVDALPGAGKTEYFVNLAERHIREGRNHILVYVAPTRRLLYETFARLYRRQVSLDNVFVVTNNKTKKQLGRLTAYGNWLKDAPATALNYLFGLISQSTYESTSYLAGFRKDCTRKLKAGDVVFTTHEAFIRVRLTDQTNQNFKTLKKCHVVFDEARKCVISNDTMTLEGKDWAALILGMECRTIHSDDTCMVSEVLRLDDPEVLRRHFGVDRDSLLPSPVRKIKALYTKYMKQGRASMYILSNSETRLGDFIAAHNKISVNLTLRPISLFQHYGKVTLVSAFLRDSQMYHFLKRDGHTFINLLAEPLAKDHLLWAVQQRSKILTKKISQRLEVAPILSTEYEVAHKYNLTSHLLQEKFVVPISFDGVSTSSKEGDISYIPEAYRVPPLWLMLREAADIFSRWKKSHDYADVALVTVNAATNTRSWRKQVRPLPVLRSIIKHGYLYQLDETEDSAIGEDQLSAGELMDVDFTPPRWISFFKKILHAPRTRLFQIPKSPVLQGVNTYSNLYAFVHLAALNPTPDLIKLYKVLLGNYDIDLDYVIDNLVQMLYRTNLRDPEGDSKVLLIIPYYSMSFSLAEKLKVKPFKQVHTPTLKAVAYTHKKAKERHREGARKGGLAKRKYKPEFALLINRAKTKISQVRKRLEVKPTPEIKKKLKDLEFQLVKLQAEGMVKTVNTKQRSK